MTNTTEALDTQATSLRTIITDLEATLTTLHQQREDAPTEATTAYFDGRIASIDVVLEDLKEVVEGV